MKILLDSKKLLGITALSLVISSTVQAGDLTARPEVGKFIDTMVQKHGFNKEALYRVFDDVVEKPKIIEILDRPSTAKPWYQYHPNFINVKRISNGLAFIRENQDALTRAEQKYGVPGEYIAAILGVETDYGRNTGSFRAIDAITTIAFDYPRRSEYYLQELEQFLILARDEKEEVNSFKSSYAGALGLPQFMPSSFHQYAVDGNGDGHKDIWNTPEDAIDSVANYLQSFGWKPSSQNVIKANVSGETYPTVVAERFNLKYTIADMAPFGIQPQTEVDPKEKAILFPIESAPGKVEYLLGLNNFYVITRYNKSTLYALSVINLAEALKNAQNNLKSSS